MAWTENKTTNLSGSAPGEEDVPGTITVPEIAHDTEEDEYVVRKPPLLFRLPCCRRITSLSPS